MTPPRQHIIAARLRALRSQRPEISQDKLATAVGVSQNAIGRWERGLSTPRAHQVADICDVYGISADYLIGRSAFPHGLAPDQFLLDEDLVEKMRSDKSLPGAPLVKVPRRLRIVEHDEAMRIRTELKLDRR